jgi:hypothetical protein
MLAFHSFARDVFNGYERTVMKKIVTMANVRMAQIASAPNAWKTLFTWPRLSRRKFTMPSTTITKGVITTAAKKTTRSTWPRISLSCLDIEFLYSPTDKTH